MGNRWDANEQGDTARRHNPEMYQIIIHEINKGCLSSDDGPRGATCKLQPRPRRFVWRADRAQMEAAVGEGGLGSVTSSWEKVFRRASFEQRSRSLFHFIVLQS